jgi:hypothetical protein
MLAGRVTQCPFHFESGVLSLRLKLPAREARYCPSSAEIKNEWSYSSSILTFRRIFGRSLNKIKITLNRRIPSVTDPCSMVDIYRGADKSLARPG